MSIYWLASYPKSGNTWLRIFLLQLKSGLSEKLNINNLEKIPNAASRYLFDQAINCDSSELTDQQILDVRAQIYKYWSNLSNEPLIYKIHDIYSRDGYSFIPMEETKKIVYLIRNPLDVCVSFAHHNGHKDFDKVIEFMSDRNAAIGKQKCNYHFHITQYLGSWSEHVAAWTRWPEAKRIIIRYEDMVSSPIATFSKITNFLGLESNENDVRSALEMCKFDVLQQREGQEGFSERLIESKHPFFRSGKAGDWQHHLTPTQTDRLIADHYDAMKEFNYLDDYSNLVI